MWSRRSRVQAPSATPPRDARYSNEYRAFHLPLLGLPYPAREHILSTLLNAGAPREGVEGVGYRVEIIREEVGIGVQRHRR